MQSRRLQHVVQSGDVDSDRTRDVLLSDGAQQRSHVDDRVNSLVDDDSAEAGGIQDVGVDVRACGSQLALDTPGRPTETQGAVALTAGSVL